tara:strand:+ start:867 stop:995 length:129 start_codon:yes stop_codon:yes gene_type:complete
MLIEIIITKRVHNAASTKDILIKLYIIPKEAKTSFNDFVRKK